MTQRSVEEIRTAHASRDGDGVAIQRISGMVGAGMDPVLLLDELRSDYREDFAGGFPPHPHRGMQTLTYMKRGGILHEDSQGNRGEIRGGGAQWMSAGRGVIHSEMPTQDTTGLHGFQLWFNLPAADKLSEPAYRDFAAAELGQLETADYHVTAIAGDWVLDQRSVSGPLRTLAAAGAVLDTQLGAGRRLSLSGLADSTLLVYVYTGAGTIAGTQLTARQLAITGQGDSLTLAAGGQGLQALVLRGQALREPVAHYGPFVMNTQQEIEQALRDYRDGKLA